jgi:acylphosphatase
MIHYDVKIHGNVQGVGFRYYAKQTADVLGIFGWVRNESDGSVTLEAEGEEEKIIQFLQWCRTGPRYAKIEKVDIDVSDIKNYSDFKILV